MKVTLIIEPNKLTMSTGTKSEVFYADKSFSSERLLIADFDLVAKQIGLMAKSLGLVGFISRKHYVTLKVKDVFKDGIAPIEQKLYEELATSISMDLSKISIESFK